MSTALITGGSRGFGAAFGAALARDQWTVILTARTSSALLHTVDVIGHSGAVIGLAGDVDDPDHRSRLAEAVESIGGLDLLVNNASDLGTTPLPHLVDYPLDRLAALFETNVVAPLALVQSMLPQLRPGAAVVNISSDAAVSAYQGWGGYGAAKAALDQLSAVLAVELPHLLVYAFDPGDMRTQMHQDAFPGEDISDRPHPEQVVPALRQLLERRLPSGRYTAASLLAQVGTSV